MCGRGVEMKHGTREVAATCRGPVALSKSLRVGMRKAELRGYPGPSQSRGAGCSSLPALWLPIQCSFYYSVLP